MNGPDNQNAFARAVGHPVRQRNRADLRHLVQCHQQRWVEPAVRLQRTDVRGTDAKIQGTTSGQGGGVLAR